MFYLYILRTAANHLYIGSTSHLNNRLKLHQSGKGAVFTKTNQGPRLVYAESHHTLDLVRRRERQLKNWSRAKKEALIAGNLDLLRQL